MLHRRRLLSISDPVSTSLTLIPIQQILCVLLFFLEITIRILVAHLTPNATSRFSKVICVQLMEKVFGVGTRMTEAPFSVKRVTRVWTEPIT